MNTITILSPELLQEASIRRLALDGANIVPREGSDIYLDTTAVKLEKLMNDLIYTLNYNDVVATHRASACNLLCTLVEKCSQSPIERFQRLIWSHGIWVQAFDVFLNQQHSLNIKPSRQLMASLVSVLIKCSDSINAKAAKITTLNRLVGILCSTTENVPIRPALQALAHFSTKKFASIDDLYAAYCIANDAHSSSAELDARLRSLLELTLHWAPFDDFASSVGLLASAILQSYQRQHTQAQEELVFHCGRSAPWADVIVRILAANPASLDNLRHYVFPELFKHEPQDYVAFLERLQLHRIFGDNTQEDQATANPFPPKQLEDVLFCAMSVGSRIDMVQVAAAPAPNSTGLYLSNSSLCIPDRLLGDLLVRSSTKVRVAALSMLINATSTTKPLSHGSLQALRKGLPYLHADSDSGLRSELFSLVKILIDRLRGATSNLAKPPTRGGKAAAKTKATTESIQSIEDTPALLKAHRSFVEWYLEFLQTELRPTASYQRHITAVKCIAFIYRSGVDPSVPSHLLVKTAFNRGASQTPATWPFEINILNEDMSALLIDLLFDPFDDVRLETASILGFVGSDPEPQSTSHETRQRPLTLRLTEALERAERMMMRTGRADQADGVAQIYSIIFSRCGLNDVVSSAWWESKLKIMEHIVTALEQTLRIAAADISKAVSKHPLHGLFISLRYILEKQDFYTSMEAAPPATLQALFFRIYECIRQTWSCVRDTLCNDAPEGFVPEDVDEEDDLSTKDVLSYSWRALREASMVMRTVVKSCPLAESEHPLMTPEHLQELGDLSFTQLAELRHRGAFSTVSQTFTACCLSCKKISSDEDNVLEKWYDRAILCIQNQTMNNTRRSAGLPSLMIGIIIADECSGVMFTRAIRDLTKEATKPVDKMEDQSSGLSQVHALNCLKDIFKNSKLGERSEAHVPVTLGLAANFLSSDTWAVRNSGLMLFRALLDRLLGSNDAYDDSETASRSRLSYAAVPNLMEIILKLLSPPTDSSNAMVTEGVFPALQLLQRAQPPPEKRGQIREAVFRLTSSSQWHIRDKAARTYAALVPQQECANEAARLLKEVRVSSDATHGALLSARYLMRRARSQSEDITLLSTAVNTESNVLYHNSNCPFTQAAFIDLQTECLNDSYQARQAANLPIDATVELNAILELPQGAYAANSSLRQSLAHLLISKIPLLQSDHDDNVDLNPTVLRLAERDPDACATMLKMAKRLCIDNQQFRKLACPILSEICTSILFQAYEPTDLEVRAAAQDVILTLLDSQQADVVRETLTKQADSLHLPADNATPLFQDKRLVLQAALLELRMTTSDQSGRSLAADLAEWILTLEAALHEDSPFDTRLAAAQAVCQIDKGLLNFSASDIYRASFLSYCIAVYDLTNDDDDDVRTIAARAACNIIFAAANGKEDLMPFAAGSKLMVFLTTKFISSDSLGTFAIGRLSGGNISAQSVSPVSITLRAAAQQDTALFVQEKQNLFIDGTREARVWSQVLIKLDSKALPLPLVSNLANWTMDGIEALAAALEQNADGLLGWARRPEVFQLGLQLIYAAEVLLAICGKVKTTVSGSEVREKLVRFLSVGRKSEVSPLWISNAEKVLERSILRGVSKVGGLVSLVPGARPEPAA